MAHAAASSVLLAPACPSASLAAGGGAGRGRPHGRPVPGSGPCGLSVGCPAASASNSESLSFCRGPCSAEGEGIVRAWVETGASPSSRLPPRRLGAGAGSTPFHAHPASPCAGEESAHCCTAEIVKLNFPDVQAPGACACCPERRWGLGSHAALCPRRQTTGPRPHSPALSASLLPSDPTAMPVSGQPQGPRLGPGVGRQVLDVPRLVTEAWSGQTLGASPLA